jgi:hypothetical protein
MSKYLYGAAVQGIQDYIFQTNELQDIIGASELVNEICTNLFKETVGTSFNEKHQVVAAAGNIKYEFDSKEECEKVVRVFPKKVMEAAPGITISQAVIEMNEENFGTLVDTLEAKLRAQRNRPMRSLTMGLMGIQRSRATGLLAVKTEDGEFIDLSTAPKREKGKKGTRQRLCNDAFGDNVANNKNFPFNISDICNKNNWVAVIHADGNGLGQIVQKIGKDKEKFSNFSKSLDAATHAAAQAAYTVISEKYHFETEPIIPIRPIVVGGDDFTVICRGEFAIEYVAAYMENFEKETEKKLSDIGVGADVPKKLTACAGIAFIKANYPFYYGCKLAEALCGAAKNDAKKDPQTGKQITGIAPSCLMFHKVQDSFVADYDKIKKRELQPCENVSYEFGPYYLEKQNNRVNWTIEELLEKVPLLADKEGSAIKSHLRQWMTIMADRGEDAAEQHLNRLTDLMGDDLKDKYMSEKIIKKAKENNTDENAQSSKEESVTKVYPVFDILSLCSVMNKTTNKNE